MRAKERERRLLTELTQCDIPADRRAIYGRLPSIITQVWSIMRSANGRPMPLGVVASRVADSSQSGLSPGMSPMWFASRQSIPIGGENNDDEDWNDNNDSFYRELYHFRVTS